MKIEEGLPDNPMDEPVADRVARGVALLDELGPAGWRSMVDPRTLVMSEPDQCVLGQVYGDYIGGLRVLNGHSSVQHAARYGFDVPHPRMPHWSADSSDPQWGRSP